MNNLYNFWDANYISFAQWFWTNTWRIYDFDGWNNENYSVLNEFLLLRENYMIRPYPRAVAGIPISFKARPPHVPTLGHVSAQWGDVPT